MTDIEKSIDALMDALQQHRKERSAESWWRIQMAAREIPSKEYH